MSYWGWGRAKAVDKKPICIWWQPHKCNADINTAVQLERCKLEPGTCQRISLILWPFPKTCTSLVPPPDAAGESYEWIRGFKPFPTQEEVDAFKCCNFGMSVFPSWPWISPGYPNIDSVVQEAKDRNAGLIRDFASFITLRRRSIAVYICDTDDYSRLGDITPGLWSSYDAAHARPYQRYCRPGECTLCSADYPLRLTFHRICTYSRRRTPPRNTTTFSRWSWRNIFHDCARNLQLVRWK